MGFWTFFRQLLGFSRVGAVKLAPEFIAGTEPLLEERETRRPGLTLKERVQGMRPIDVGRGGFNQPIVGESHCQDALRRVKAEAFVEVAGSPIATFLLARQPENPHDPSAIAVLTEDGELVGYLSRELAPQLQPKVLEHEQRGEVLSCYGKLIGKDLIGVWLNLAHLVEERQRAGRVEESVRRAEVTEEYGSLDVCRDALNVSDLVAALKPYGRSRPNWVGNRIAAIGEERYTANLERVSKGKCEQGAKIELKVLLVPDTANTIDPKAVMVTTIKGDVLGYLSKSHAMRWEAGIQGFFESGRVVCRQGYLHQRTFKSGKRTFYLSVEMTDEDWLGEAASRRA